MVPEVRADERTFSISKRRRDDRRPCRLCTHNRPGAGDDLCGVGVSQMASHRMDRLGAGDRSAWAAGNPGGPVYLFRLVTAAADAVGRLHD
ncbi:hypothetical protein D3C85_1211860 [compost metagenome]